MRRDGFRVSRGAGIGERLGGELAIRLVDVGQRFGPRRLVSRLGQQVQRSALELRILGCTQQRAQLLDERFRSGVFREPDCHLHGVMVVTAEARSNGFVGVGVEARLGQLADVQVAHPQQVLEGVSVLPAGPHNHQPPRR